VSAVSVREARPEDGPAVIALIEALLDYEHIGPMAEGAHERVLAEMFAPEPRFETFVAEAGGTLVGYAIVYETFSTLRGRPRLFIEDIFVLPEHRGTGAGFALFRAVAAHALEHACASMHWEVLTWNRLAIGFYERLGGTRDEEWYTYRLDKSAMRRLAYE
jgi:GNAT superfamily N-acetyltransferase